MWKNKLKTVALLALLSGLFMFIGNIIGGKEGITIAFGIAMIMNSIAYFFSDKIVLAMYGAKPLDQTHYASLYATVRELSERMKLPMPKLWLVDSPVANAFATGRNPANGSIAVTTGILKILEPHELRGVLAHELSHIYNRDILVTSIAATIATSIGYIANMFQHMLWWGAVSGENRRKDSGNLIGALVIAILMPIAASIVQLAISRSREYLADETGSHACYDPLALAAALQKLHNHTKYAHFDTTDTAHASTASLFIVNPFLSGGFMELFSTHPPLEKRIQRLQRLYEQGRLTFFS